MCVYDSTHFLPLTAWVSPQEFPGASYLLEATLTLLAVIIVPCALRPGHEAFIKCVQQFAFVSCIERTASDPKRLCYSYQITLLSFRLLGQSEDVKVTMSLRVWVDVSELFLLPLPAELNSYPGWMQAMSTSRCLEGVYRFQTKNSEPKPKVGRDPRECFSEDKGVLREESHRKSASRIKCIDSDAIWFRSIRSQSEIS